MSIDSAHPRKPAKNERRAVMQVLFLGLARMFRSRSREITDFDRGWLYPKDFAVLFASFSSPSVANGPNLHLRFPQHHECSRVATDKYVAGRVRGPRFCLIHMFARRRKYVNLSNGGKLRDKCTLRALIISSVAWPRNCNIKYSDNRLILVQIHEACVDCVIRRGVFVIGADWTRGW